MRAFQSVLLIIFCLLLLALAWGQSGDTPTPTPRPMSPGAEVVQQAFGGLESLGINEPIEAAAAAVRADTQAAHTSKVGQWVKDISPLFPFCLVLVFFLLCFVMFLALLYVYFTTRQGADIAALLARLENTKN